MRIKRIYEDKFTYFEYTHNIPIMLKKVLIPLKITHCVLFYSNPWINFLMNIKKKREWKGCTLEEGIFILILKLREEELVGQFASLK